MNNQNLRKGGTPRPNKQLGMVRSAAFCAVYMVAYPAVSATVSTIYDFGGKLKEARDPDVNTDVTFFRGAIYGSTIYGGGGGPRRMGSGAIYRFLPAAQKEQTVFAFSGIYDHIGTLTLLNGLFYGVTQGDGANNFGTIVKLDPLTRAVTVLHSFTAVEGYPSQTLLSFGGKLYGTTSGPSFETGTLFSLDPTTNIVTDLHEQSSAEGVHLQWGVVSDGTFLYGTAKEGGQYGFGTLFKYDPATSQETLIHSFRNEAGAVRGVPAGGLFLHSGEAFGTAYTYNNKSYRYSIYKITLTTGFAEQLHQYPKAGGASNDGLQFRDGLLYGTAYSDDTSLYGSVFTLDIKIHAYTVVHSFTNSPDGAGPSGLTRHGELFYGTTFYGGANGSGTVFTVTP